MRRPERIPIVMRLLKNPLIFYHYFQCKGLEFFQFQKRYEDLFFLWTQYPDLRFGQLLISEGVVEDESYAWNREESNWLVDKGYIKPEDIYMWGTYGKNGKEKIQNWYNNKPVIGVPLSIEELIADPDLRDLEEIEIYAHRYSRWLKQYPDPQYKFLKDLETNHIENILITEKPAHKQILERLLKERYEQEDKEKERETKENS